MIAYTRAGHAVSYTKDSANGNRYAASCSCGATWLHPAVTPEPELRAAFFAHARMNPFPECSCEMCQRACKTHPGLLVPDDVARLAAFLHVPVDELCATLLVPDSYTGGAALRPVYSHGKGACVFYDTVTGQCGVHAAKPYECAMVMHDMTREAGVALRVYILSQWKDYGDTSVA